MMRLLIFVLSFAPLMLTAEESARAQVPSVIYLQFLNQNAPQWLCQQDATFSCLGIPATVCTKGIESAAKRCGPTLLSQWPESFTESQENALFYGDEYRQCILEDWITQQWVTPEQLTLCEPNNSL